MSILASELSNQLESEAAPVVVDVRSAWEYRHGSIPGAIHLPFWRSWILNTELNIRPEQQLVVYCEHGPRAILAKLFLGLRGFKNVHLLKGHMMGWKKNGLPVQAYN